MIYVIVADGHEIVRKGFAYIFSKTPDIVLAGEAGTCEEFLELARRVRFDVAIIDIATPKRGGLELLDDLRREFPTIKAIIVSTYTEKQYAIRSYKCGAMACLCKSQPCDEILAAVRTVSEGRRFITQEAAECLAQYVSENHGHPVHEDLTTREMQVLVLIGAGLPPRKIAEKLSLSVKTIGTYRDRIMKKMNFTSNAQIIKYTIDNNLVPFS